MTRRKTQSGAHEDLFGFKRSDGTIIDEDPTDLNLRSTQLGNQGAALKSLEPPQPNEISISTDLDTGVNTMTEEDDHDEPNMEDEDAYDGIASIASDDSTVVPLVARECEARRDHANVNDQVNDLLRAQSGEEATPLEDNDDIIDIPDTTVEGTTTEEGGIATRTRARRLETGTVLACLDTDWKKK